MARIRQGSGALATIRAWTYLAKLSFEELSFSSDFTIDVISIPFVDSVLTIMHVGGKCHDTLIMIN
jgi:hypothetical protein